MKRFFPTPSTSRASSGPAFLNPDNRSNSASSGGRPRRQESAILSALDKLQNTGINRPPSQLGHSALRRKPDWNALTLDYAGSIMRPGTAAPRVSEERGSSVGLENRNILIAPTPKRYHQMPPRFAAPDGLFGSESQDASRDEHSSTSPDNIIEEKREDSFKVPFPKKANVQQHLPVQPEPSQYQPRLLQRRHEPSPVPSDSEDQVRSNTSSLQRNKKRIREFDGIEEDDMEKSVKRFKTELEDDKMSQHESRSPHLERPSSTTSSVLTSYHDLVVDKKLPARVLQVERQENPNLNSFSSSNRSHVALPSRRRSEPMGLDNLLGPGSNALIDQNADRYEAFVKKWSECSVEEWKVGAQEISARFTSMFDFVKDYVDQKLKTYSGLNAILDSHCEILRERNETMGHAKQKLVKEGAGVLG